MEIGSGIWVPKELFRIILIESDDSTKLNCLWVCRLFRGIALELFDTYYNFFLSGIIEPDFRVNLTSEQRKELRSTRECNILIQSGSVFFAVLWKITVKPSIFWITSEKFKYNHNSGFVKCIFIQIYRLKKNLKPNKDSKLDFLNMIISGTLNKDHFKLSKFRNVIRDYPETLLYYCALFKRVSKLWQISELIGYKRIFEFDNIFLLERLIKKNCGDKTYKKFLDRTMVAHIASMPKYRPDF